MPGDGARPSKLLWSDGGWWQPGVPSARGTVTAPRGSPARRLSTDPERVEKGVAQLVLTLIELVRQLMERQALHRLDRGSLTGDQEERVGLALMRLAETMDELKEHFGFSDEDLNLHLGPLGDLL
jgi:hypothetical protein